MVKKIDSKRPVSAGQSAPIEAGKAVGTAKVGAVGRVSSTEGSAATEKARRATRPMTVEEREMILNLVKEEAQRMCESKALPKHKRETVESAVKMAIDGAIVEEEDEGKNR